MEKSYKGIKIYTTKFIGKKAETKDTITFKFEIPKDLSWSDGTHFHIAFTDCMTDFVPDKELMRHFSVMSMRDEGFLGLTTRIKGELSIFKKRLSKLEVGDEMLVFKFADYMPLKRESRPIVLISMGVGLATFRPLIKQFQRDSDGIPTMTCINIDSCEEFVYKDEISMIDKENFINHHVISRKELYKNIDECLKDDKSLYYVVASDGFLKEICS